MTKLILKLNTTKNFLLGIFLFGLNSFPVFAEKPFADIHLHYNWDQAETISPAEVISKIKKTNTRLAIISSTPTHLALELKQKAGNWLYPIFSPYTHELGKQDWYVDTKLVDKVEQGLKSGNYFGLGEIHFMAGFPPNSKNKNFKALMNLAKRYQVPVLIHVDSGDEKYFLDICTKHKKVKILFAHAGGNLSANHIQEILTTCSNVWLEFSARDPWRYGGLTDESHYLLEEWKIVIIKFSNRILTGTDPVWRVTRTQSWDQVDDGWDHYEKLHQFHQSWINTLPSKIQEQIRWTNAREFLNLKP